MIRRFAAHGLTGWLDRREDNGPYKLTEAFLGRLDDVVRGRPSDYGLWQPGWTREQLALVLEWQAAARRRQ